MSSLISKLFWLHILSTPYPYVVISVAIATLGVIIGILAYRQSFIVDASFFAILVAIVCALVCNIISLDEPTTNPNLDNKKLDVMCYTNFGPRLSTGRIVTPAGCSFLSIGSRRRKNPKAAMEEFVGGGKVLLKWSDEMDGYQIFNEKNEDMSAYLVSRGLVRTKSLASEELRALEREARANRIGIWERTWRGKGEFYRWPDLIATVLLSIGLVFMVVVAVFEYWEVICLR